MVLSDSQMQIQMQEPIDGSLDSIGEDQSSPRMIDGFAITALILAAIVLVISLYYYRKSKQELKIIVDLLKRNGSSS
jgi:hypothetical protein